MVRAGADGLHVGGAVDLDRGGARRRRPVAELPESSRAPAEGHSIPARAGVRAPGGHRDRIGGIGNRRARSVRRGCVAELHPVTALNCEIAGEPVAVGVQIRLRTTIVLRPPDVSQTREHCAMDGRVSNNGKVKQSGLCATGRNKERIGDPIPVWRSTVVEVNLDLGIEIGVEPKSGIRRVETGKTSVTENGLRPRH